MRERGRFASRGVVGSQKPVNTAEPTASASGTRRVQPIEKVCHRIKLLKLVQSSINIQNPLSPKLSTLRPINPTSRGEHGFAGDVALCVRLKPGTDEEM